MTIRVIIALFLVLNLCYLSKAQINEAFNYQALLRDSRGNPLPNTSKPLQVDIIQNNQIVYSEIHLGNVTDNFGLMSVRVGRGAPQPIGTPPTLSVFSKIKWGYLPTNLRISIAGGSLISESPILAAPIALYALQSGNSLDSTWSKTNDNIFRVSGNVGIATANPDSKLHIDGNIHLSNSARIYFQGGPSDPHYFIESYKIPESAAMRIKGWGGVNLTTSVGDVLNITGLGNVGIGLANPDSKLHIDGNFHLNGSSKIYFQDGPSNPNCFIESYTVSPRPTIRTAAMRIKGYGGINLSTKVDDALNVDDGGNVGIGITAPEYKLDVNGMIGCGSRIYVGRNETEDNYSLVHFKGGSALHGGIIRASRGNDDEGNAPISYEGSSHTFNTTVSVPVLEVRGADIVEKFQSKETLEAGILVTIDENDIHNYKTTNKAYQKGIVGIVSGANGVKHGMLLEQNDALAGNTKVAIAGRVYVKATAQNGAIKAGDMLTSSDKVGYAMKSTNRRKAYGSVIGKALTSLASGEGYVLVLVGLQ